ncbi:MAG: leucine-rich repeat protein [Bdellovibrionales bacterium]
MGDAKEISKHAFAGLDHLESLEIEAYEGWDVIHPETFSDLSSLRKLEINYPNFEYLPTDLFRNLGFLEELKLYRVKLREWNAETFAPLINLKSLVVENYTSQMPIGGHTIPEGLLRSMTHLQTLSFTVGRVKHSTLPTNLLSGLTQLKYIDLGGNHIKSLDESFFKDQARLEKLILWFNDFYSIEAMSLKPLISIQELDLSNNKILSIFRRDFKTFSMLKKIDLSNIELYLLPERVFKNNPLMEEVNLRANKLLRNEDIEDHALAGLVHLKVLDLSSNYPDSKGPISISRIGISRFVTVLGAEIRP